MVANVTVTMNMDFELLRQQKRTLCYMLINADEEEYDTLEGILNLIDYIQDTAIEQGVPREEVFNLSDDDQ